MWREPELTVMERAAKLCEYGGWQSMYVMHMYLSHFLGLVTLSWPVHIYLA